MIISSISKQIMVKVAVIKIFLVSCGATVCFARQEVGRIYLLSLQTICCV